MGGLLAVMEAVNVVIVIHRNKRRNEGVEEYESGSDIVIDMMETMTVFNGSDHSAIQENTDQIRTDELLFVVEEYCARVADKHIFCMASISKYAVRCKRDAS
jgi:hypothetical protein